MESAVNNGMCRCCASEGTFKDVKTTYHWMGEEEIYSDMLKECFDISLLLSEDGDDGGICEVCITQLRNAANFKKQVQHTEDQFKQRLQNKSYKCDIVKIEPTKEDDEENESDNNMSEDNFSTAEYEVPIKTEELLEELNPKKRPAAAKPTTSRAKKIKVDDGETSSKRIAWDAIKIMSKVSNPATMQSTRPRPPSDVANSREWLVSIKKGGTQPMKRASKVSTASTLISPTTQRPSNLLKNLGWLLPIKVTKSPKTRQSSTDASKTLQLSMSIKKEIKQQMKKPIVAKESRQDQSSKPVKISNEINLQLHNIRTILLNSNATPFNTIARGGFSCCFCINNFQNPAEIKKHTLEKHDDSDKRTFMQGSGLYDYQVKLDITDLICGICYCNIQGLEELIEHLSAHDKKIYKNLKNHILPFKFDKDTMYCVVCLTTFVHFKQLQEHMNTHYRNYVCYECNVGYINLRGYKSHCNRHKQGEFKCKFCSKVFGTNSKKSSHEKYVHIADHKRNKCTYCPEKFITYAKKRAHMVEEHGAKPLILNCQACDKTFLYQSRLTRHVARDHLMVRKYECKDCDKKFFTKKELTNHSTKHTGIKNYQCDVCSKSYGRKYTLREHMRIHADDRRFKCKHCAQAFVQKCSWRSHMRSKHGEVV